jgi:hypothetical protein
VREKSFFGIPVCVAIVFFSLSFNWSARYGKNTISLRFWLWNRFSFPWETFFKWWNNSCTGTLFISNKKTWGVPKKAWMFYL